mmetsp:Transcript_93565/g.302835  ORF Transcript_93565/g.302835 Transcript_93565/m.302835 type:complete len:401 (+) Transcript_93565:113-1315(+)
MGTASKVAALPAAPLVACATLQVEDRLCGDADLTPPAVGRIAAPKATARRIHSCQYEWDVFRCSAPGGLFSGGLQGSCALSEVHPPEPLHLPPPPGLSRDPLFCNGEDPPLCKRGVEGGIASEENCADVELLGGAFRRPGGDLDIADEPAHWKWDSITVPIPRRKLSDACFDLPEQTIIILDWDDTLCPTSLCFESLRLPSSRPVADPALAARLGELAAEVVALLERARTLAGHVVIVTNAGDGWVESSARAWLPAVADVLGSVEVVSARARWEPHGISCPTGWKTKEFERVIRGFYSQYEDQSWKNIVVVGDAQYEHDALRKVVGDAPTMCAYHCRPKSVRFKTKPSLDVLSYQIRTLCETFQDITQFDGELDIEIPSEHFPAAENAWQIEIDPLTALE